MYNLVMNMLIFLLKIVWILGGSRSCGTAASQMPHVKRLFIT